MGRGLKRDTERHRTARKRARAFLRLLGCTKLVSEYSIADETGKRFYIDEVGFKPDKQMVAMECGGVEVKKLYAISLLFDEIYILPYGMPFPYQWTDAMTSICRYCGADNTERSGEPDWEYK